MRRNKLMQLALCLAISLFGTGVSEAYADPELSDGEIVYSYNNSGSVSTFGTAKKENYEVAMHLTGNDLVGKTITKVLVPIGDATNITNLKVWLSKELTLETVSGKKVTVPDVLSQDVEVAGDTIEVALDAPYTITSDGIYVGYSFEIETLDSDNSYPILVCGETSEGGMFLHTSRTYRSWMDKSADANLAMGVVLSGVDENAAGVSVPDIINVTPDNSQTVAMTVSNHGWKGVQSIEYSYTVNGNTSAFTVDLGDAALPARYNATASVDVEIPALGLTDTTPITFTISKVNGMANEDASATAEASLITYIFIPTHRAVLEEYTGTWCGYCPRGFVALEVMNRLYPDDFIGISYHNSDDMEIMASSLYPSSVSGFPAAYIDRYYSTDAYYGDYDSFGIDKTWLSICEQLAPADINVTASLADDGKYVNVKTSTIFPSSLDNTDYSVEFVLVSDSLYDESWGQSNYYANGAYGTFPEPEFEQFTSGGSYVYGLKFNDVIIATSRLAGDNAELPSTIAGQTPMEASYTFDLSTAVNTSGTSLVQNVNNLRVVALLIDNTTGYIVNANKCKVAADSATGISSVRTDNATNGKAEFYDVLGRKYNSAVKGMNIMKTADGKVVKVYRK